ncbi:ribonuclease M5 [Mogibacterium pumilum]|uniref:Ribonuclease M5 n=1 Tax=Mogibacterium pumilum TaxID=86332 RepID=A0A223AQN2_9FIRM|nr:ribonuclease M5 [Mogibacterium pumilum]ASS37278.1 ribonuclease M5 [Mogibacterium pumilum]
MQKISNSDNGEKLKIREAIIVEGRDDINAVSKACDALIIATHGFGITRETWALIEKAYNEKGIIILTDPDFSGEEIRRKLSAKFPKALQAYLPKAEATKSDDIGVENATPRAIREALMKIHDITKSDGQRHITMKDLSELELVGGQKASALRESVGAELGIGYGNGKAFLKKLNGFGITREELEAALLKAQAK